MEYPDQLTVRRQPRWRYPGSLGDLLDEAAARDPAVEEILGDLCPHRTSREFVRAARHLLAGGLLPAPEMVYRTVRLLAAASPLTAGDVNIPVGPYPLPRLGDLAGRGGLSVGRDAERKRAVQELTRRASGVSLVVITGPAGVGKTRLADEIMEAGELAGFTPVRLSLRPALRGDEREDPAVPAYDALLDLLTALGVPPSRIPATRDGRQALYHASAGGRRLLIELDGVVDASQVLPLLPPEPGAVLVTSRRLLSGLADRQAVQLRLGPLDHDASRLLIQRCFRAAQQEASEGVAPQEPGAGVIAAISDWCGGMPVPVVAVSRWIITAARQEGVSWDVLIERFGAVRRGADGDGDDAALTMRVLFTMLSPDQQLMVHVFGSLPVTETDLPAACLSTGLSQDRAAGALEQLIELGWIARRPHNGWVMDGHVAAYARVAGPPREPGAPSAEQALDWLVSRAQVRLRHLRELMNAPEVATRPAVRAWVYERWRAERESAAGLLEVAAGGADPGPAQGLASAFMDVAVLTSPMEDGWRETQRYVAPILRIARATHDPRLEAVALWRFGGDELRQGSADRAADLLRRACDRAGAADDEQLSREIQDALRRADTLRVSPPSEGQDPAGSVSEGPAAAAVSDGPADVEEVLTGQNVPHRPVLFGAPRVRAR